MLLRRRQLLRLHPLRPHLLLTLAGASPRSRAGHPKLVTQPLHLSGVHPPTAKPSQPRWPPRAGDATAAPVGGTPTNSETCDHACPPAGGANCRSYRRYTSRQARGGAVARNSALRPPCCGRRARAGSTHQSEPATRGPGGAEGRDLPLPSATGWPSSLARQHRPNDRIRPW